MDDLADGITEVLKKMGEAIKIFPFQDTDAKDRLFLARFEFPKNGMAFTFSEAAEDNSVGFVDFLTGFPLDCIEMFVAVGEFSSKANMVNVQAGTGASSPVPASGRFFKWPDSSKILLNLTAIPTKNVARFFAPNLEGELEPHKAHWWFRVQLIEGKKFPVPGEFLGLGIRMFPGKYWGHQKSSPFVYSGNWMDTVYYTAGRITEVIDPTDEVPYATYKVTWHGKDKDEEDNEITVNPSDFALYKVGDRVTIVKDVATDKGSQLWKDDDMKTFGETWMIAPIGFYGLEIQEEG